VGDSIAKRLADEDISGERTLLGLLAKSVDPDTGEKLSQAELTTNANIMMYHHSLTK